MPNTLVVTDFSSSHGAHYPSWVPDHSQYHGTGIIDTHHSTGTAVDSSHSINSTDSTQPTYAVGSTKTSSFGSDHVVLVKSAVSGGVNGNANSSGWSASGSTTYTGDGYSISGNASGQGSWGGSTTWSAGGQGCMNGSDGQICVGGSTNSQGGWQVGIQGTVNF